MQDYGLALEKYDKKTGELVGSFLHNEDKGYYTASTMKLVLLGLFIEYCYDELYDEVLVSQKDKTSGGLIYKLKTQRLTYEVLITLMMSLSDNTATNIVFDELKRKLGDLSSFVRNKFDIDMTEVLDIREQDFDNMLGSGFSSAKEFIKILKYYIIDFEHRHHIKNIMNDPYNLKGIGLRYIDLLQFDMVGSKTGQTNTMLNDCGFMEDSTHIYIYVVFYYLPNPQKFMYQTESSYYKKVGKLIKQAKDFVDN